MMAFPSRAPAHRNPGAESSNSPERTRSYSSRCLSRGSRGANPENCKPRCRPNALSCEPTTDEWMSSSLLIQREDNKRRATSAA